MLIEADLSDDLIALFASFPPSKEDAALAIANAYHDYVELHLFGGSHALLIGAFRDAMATTLEIGLSVPGAPPTIANAIATAVDVYWGGLVPVPVAGLSGSGEVAGCPGKSDLQTALTGIFANLANTAETAGADIAAALHTATLTVEADISGSMVPIS